MNTQQFLMRHMPKALNGDMEYEIGQYVKNGKYGQYKELAYEFFKNNDNPREYVANIFGTGQYKFWCFEYNLLDIPMYTMKTVYDIIASLEAIQVDLCDSHEPDYNWFNLWCCTGTPFENIIISSFNMSVSNVIDTHFNNKLHELCKVHDEHPDEITIEDDGRWVDTKEFPDDIHEEIYKKFILERDIRKDIIQRCIDGLIERYGNWTILTGNRKDIQYYEFLSIDKTKDIRLDTFFDDIKQAVTVDYMTTDYELIINGVDVIKPYIGYMFERMEEQFTLWYNELQQAKKDGIIDFPKKTMSVYFK